MTDTIADRFRSQLLSFSVERRSDVLRQEFRKNFMIQRLRQTSSHSHAAAAALRSAANHDCNAWVTRQGLSPYSWCASPREQTEGYRPMFRGADLKQNYRRDKLDPNIHAIVIIDSDYYVDMPKLMSKGVPILLYSFVPTTAGGSIPDGVFCWTRGNEVKVDINGGAHYQHQLWDYCSRDCISSAPNAMGSVWVYDVDYKLVPGDDSRRVIFLNPCVRLPLWSRLFRNFNVPELVRYRARVNGGAVVVRSISRGENTQAMVSISRPDECTSVMIKQDIMSEINERNSSALKGKNSRGGMPISDVERVLRTTGMENTGPAAALIHSVLPVSYIDAPLIPSGAEVEMVNTTNAPIGPPGSLHYQPLAPGEVLEEGKEVGRRVFVPLVPEGSENVFPNESRESDVLCVQKRVVEQANNMVPPTRFRMYADEFVQTTVPRSKQGCGSPLDEWQVSEQQGKRLQQERLKREWHMGLLSSNGHVKSFQKKESYLTVNAPRNISTMPTSHTLNLSRYTYPFKSNVLKDCKWYVPCKHPEQIAEEIQKFVENFDSVVEQDYSKFDGTISRWLRENVEFPVYRRYFGRKHLGDLNALFAAEMTERAKTKFDVLYNPGASRRSGSPLTTDGNTLINAFVGYCSRREAGFSPDDAWENVGLFYGDDGIVGGCNPRIYTRVAETLGLKLKANIRRRGSHVTFLQRVFLDPWTSRGSMQNPECLRKMHLSALTGVPDSIIKYYKGLGYMTTDSGTPLISAYARAMMRTAAADGMDNASLLKHRERARREQSYWLEAETCWPQIESSELAIAIQAEFLQVTPSEIVAAAEMLEAVSTTKEMEQLRGIISVPPIEIKIKAQMAGFIVQPDPEKIASIIPSLPSKTKVEGLAPISQRKQHRADDEQSVASSAGSRKRGKRRSKGGANPAPGAK